MLYNPQWSKPNIQEFTHILRDRKRWPAGFEWNYGDCERCAMGLAIAIWPEIDELPGLLSAKVARAFNITIEDARRLFILGNPSIFGLFPRTTPNQIAAALEKLA